MVTLAGEAESEKFGAAAAFTVRLMVVLRVKAPDVPVMVTVEVPVVAVLLAVNVTVLLVVVLPGLKDAVTPLGRPEADKLTLPLNPFTGLTVMVLVVPVIVVAITSFTVTVSLPAVFKVTEKLREPLSPLTKA